MKPLRIILVRHGRSEGNEDQTIYKVKPDYAVELTETGRKQAHEVGSKLKQLIGNESVFFRVSPFWRTRQTFREIEKWFDPKKVQMQEEPRFREQEWGQVLGKGFDIDIEKERYQYGHFYYRFPGGESCADVYDRVSDAITTMHRDFEKPFFPQNEIDVVHGMQMRLFLMKWFHYTVEQFEELANPKNCEYIVLQLNKETQKYDLVKPLRKYEKPTSPFQYQPYKTLPLDI